MVILCLQGETLHSKQEAVHKSNTTTDKDHSGNSGLNCVYAEEKVPYAHYVHPVVVARVTTKWRAQPVQPTAFLIETQE